MFLNESEENLQKAEKEEEEYIKDPTSNIKIKKISSFFAGNNFLLKLPKTELQIQLRKLQNNVLIAKQVSKLVSFYISVQNRCYLIYKIVKLKKKTINYYI